MSLLEPWSWLSHLSSELCVIMSSWWQENKWASIGPVAKHCNELSQLKIGNDCLRRHEVADHFFGDGFSVCQGQVLSKLLELYFSGLGILLPSYYKSSLMFWWKQPALMWCGLGFYLIPLGLFVNPVINHSITYNLSQTRNWFNFLSCPFWEQKKKKEMCLLNSLMDDHYSPSCSIFLQPFFSSKFFEQIPSWLSINVCLETPQQSRIDWAKCRMSEMLSFFQH